MPQVRDEHSRARAGSLANSLLDHGFQDPFVSQPTVSTEKHLQTGRPRLVPIPGAGSALAHQRAAPQLVSSSIVLFHEGISRVVALDPAVAQTAFQELDCLRANDKEVRQLIGRIRNEIDADERELIARRLEVLQEGYREENNGRALSADSLRSFVAFLLTASGLKRPSLSATSEGYLYGRWKGDEGRLLSVQFLPASGASFVLFHPNSVRPSKMSRQYGMTTADALMAEVIIPNQVLLWAASGNARP